MSAENGHACGGDAAAYVLGALEPAEADEFRRHIADCAECRQEVDAYRQVTSVLPAGGERHEVPRSLRRRVMREVRATPKATSGIAAPAGAARGGAARGGAARGGATRGGATQAARLGRPMAAWAGALAVVLVAIVVAVALSSGGSSGTRVIQASTGSAALRVTGGHGDLIVHRLPALPSGRTYQMWVQRGSAVPKPTGTLFGVSASGTATVGVPGSLSGVSAVLVTQEPAGGTLVPTSAPVIVARLT